MVAMDFGNMKLIIAGGRDFNDYSALERAANAVLTEYPISVILNGAAPGADALAVKWANEKKIEIEFFPADWEKYKKAAGPIRNREMAKHADILLAFWNRSSSGTKNMIEEARRAKFRDIIIIYYDKPNYDKKTLY